MTNPIPAALAGASSAIAADALDALGHRESAMDVYLAPVTPDMHLVGRAYPVVVVEDMTAPDHPYAGEMEALGAMRPGDVGVYGVASNARAAAWGELFSCAAMGRQVAGVIIDGPIRDTRQIAALGFPVFAAERSPLDTLARARVASHGEEVQCGGRSVALDDVVVADSDGIVVVPSTMVDPVAEFISNKFRLEDAARRDLIAGMSINDVWEKYRVF